jgi:hypothetical protein
LQHGPIVEAEKDNGITMTDAQGLPFNGGLFDVVIERKEEMPVAEVGQEHERCR